MKLKHLAVIAMAFSLMACEKDSGDKSTPDVSTLLWGTVSDTEGNLLQGVVVSDGYSCTATDAEGRYEIAQNENAVQINITLPAEYEVTLKDGYPDFWKTIVDGQRQYDFTLTPLPNGAEKEFNLICIADPQCQSTTHANYFETLYIPDLREEVAYVSAELPSYGVVLGDVIWNNASTYLKDTILPRMKTDWSADNTGLPVFMVIGNHDHTYRDADDIVAQRDFESTFGPINYSFDRGNVHFVCMDDIRFTKADSYQTGFRNDQVEWLRQDLSYMSKDKLLILCVHSPLRNRSGSDVPNVQNVLKLCDNFPGYHIMSGHIHTTVNYDTYSTHYEHNHGALCGAFWRGKVCADGTPNGYAVYTINGTEFTNWYYKSAEYDRDHQIRLYHGIDWFMPGYTNSWQFTYNAENQMIANVWNADGDWKVEVYENGDYSGEMTRFTSRDAWASGFYMGPKGRSTGSDYDKSSVDHLYWYNLSTNSKEANVEVVATDRFGNVYRQTEFITNTSDDYPDF